MDSRKRIGKLEDEFTIDDVGSTLLDDLAKGLYQPDEIIREYIQNAVDAHRLWKERTGFETEGPIQVEFRDNNNSISIFDYGIGMDESDIRKVKSIAVSKKHGEEVKLTGYKGVGIWAGFSYFKTLRLYSTKNGNDRGYLLQINFADIIDAINQEASIGEALNPNYSIDEFEEKTDEHFTEVSLINPVRSKGFFTDPEEVKNAIRKICPCELDETFHLHDEVVQWYEENDIDTYQIQVDGEFVYKSYPSNVKKFEEGVITLNDSPLAKYWRAVTQGNGILKPKDDQLVGFRVIQNGFVIGRTNLYDEKVRSGFDNISLASYLDWWIGEIYIELDDLRPNLRRDELEESEITRQFIKNLRSWYKELADETRIISYKTRYENKYSDFEKIIKELSEKDNLDADDKENLRQVLDQLKEHKNKFEKNRGKKNVKNKILALRDRDIKLQRRRLVNSIEKLLGNGIEEDITGSEDEEKKPSSTQETATDSKDGKTEKKEKTSEDDGEKKSGIDIELTELDDERTVVSLEALLGIIEEVVDELNHDKEFKEKLIKSIKRRINQIIYDFE